jgi:hypothetical protein
MSMKSIITLHAGENVKIVLLAVLYMTVICFFVHYFLYIRPTLHQKFLTPACPEFFISGRTLVPACH